MSASERVVLVVAGHDPTSGAGVDADRAAIEHFGARARTIVTAWTDQDGSRLRSVVPRPAAVWLAEARAELARSRCRALKTGLLANPEHVCAAASLARAMVGRPVVVDPLLAASGGEAFLDADGVAALLGELVPLGVILTPNVPELARLAGEDPAHLARDLAARERAAHALLARGARAIVVKGGHGEEDPLVDLVLERGSGAIRLAHPRARGLRIHGSGCRFSSGIAASLANGTALARAVEEAGLWLSELIRQAGAI